jgi:hypothetical protein
MEKQSDRRFFQTTPPSEASFFIDCKLPQIPEPPCGPCFFESARISLWTFDIPLAYDVMASGGIRLCLA